MSDALDNYIDGIEHLPMPPLVIIKLIATFREPYADMDDIARLLSQDPSLTAEVLKRCNSGFFRAEEPTDDIFEAIMSWVKIVVLITGIAASCCSPICESNRKRWTILRTGLNNKETAQVVAVAQSLTTGFPSL